MKYIATRIKQIMKSPEGIKLVSEGGDLAVDLIKAMTGEGK